MEVMLCFKITVVLCLYLTSVNLQGPHCDVPNFNHGSYDVFYRGTTHMGVKYSCDHGYYAVGSPVTYCRYSVGRWTNKRPTCVAPGCPDLGFLQNGRVTLAYKDAVAYFVCSMNHDIAGESTIYCDGHDWSGSKPTCTSSKVMTDGNREGGSIKEHERHPIEVQTSYESLIEHADNTCRYTRYSTPTDIANSQYQLEWKYNPSKRIYAMVAKYTCNNGFELENVISRYLFCRHHTWTAPIRPRCVQAVRNPCDSNNGGCKHICKAVTNDRYVCSCQSGYDLDSDDRSCTDHDECVSDNGKCEQTCHNTNGSYFCTCREGYYMSLLNCIDVDECKDNNKNSCPGPCINLPGSFMCDCDIAGYQNSSSGHFCEDLDECSIENGGCEDLCENSRGSYRCRCDQRGVYLAEDLHSCADIDECERYFGKVCLHGNCFNNLGSYSCQCFQGFEQSPDGSTCDDHDECTENNGDCEGMCVNMIGSFKCTCDYSGYQIDTDGRTCVDIDECEDSNGGCEDTCVNVAGSYYCVCTQLGNVLDGNQRTCSVCEDNQYIDEEAKKCHDCPANSITTGGVSTSLSDCVCQSGFQGMPRFGIECEDIDECVESKHDCAHRCQNTAGSAHCTCPDGYTLMDDGINCSDKNECLENHGGCNQTCINTEGSFYCSCASPVFTLHKDGKACIDVDECVTDGIICSHICVNLLDGFRCECHQGYTLAEDQQTCLDIDECISDVNNCVDECRNTLGSYFCECNSPGYKLSSDKISCIDINECMEGENPCEESCENLQGSYRCLCLQHGLQLSADGISCIDINECLLEETNNCEHSCINTMGSYRCGCQPGYYKYRSHCNPCAVGWYSGEDGEKCVRCPARATTNQTATSSIEECFCISGYHGNPTEDIECSDINECANSNFECTHLCVNTAGSAYCTCLDGYQLMDDGKDCTDVNECLTHGRERVKCEDRCINTDGSYYCKCDMPGYQLHSNNRNCVDVNECVLDVDKCEDQCVNIPGTYRCYCREQGFQLASDGFHCEDINECSSNDTNDCHHQCINMPGSYVCQCDLGHVMLLSDICEGCRMNSYQMVSNTLCQECPTDSVTDGVGKTSLADCVCRRGFSGSPVDDKPCIDLNECEDGNFGCSHNCINTPGSVLCACPGAFQLLDDGKTCQDIDECSVNNGGCDQGCFNFIGGYSCRCDSGYIWNGGLNVCQDEDECLADNGGCSEICENYDGGHYCSCPKGQILQQDERSCSAIHCTPLFPPTFGHISPLMSCDPEDGAVSVRTLCRISCKPGYKLIGSSSRKCRNDGQWSQGKDAICRAKTCRRLKTPTHGNILPKGCSSDRIPFRKHCLFSCDEGYTLKGSALIMCGQGLRWTPNPPSCVKAKCSEDCHPDFGVCTLEDTCQCKVGYHGETCGECIPFPGCEHGTCAEPFECECDEGWGGLLCDKDLIPPTVLFCPESVVNTSTTQTTAISWDEPLFEDNFKIESVSKSHEPGSSFNWGQWEVIYIAMDTGGHSVNCTFTVDIQRIECGSPLGPLNGDAGCSDWLYGKFCVPMCFDGHMFYPPVVEVYGCGVDVTWKPSRHIPDCVGFREISEMEECEEGEEFWADLQRCVQCPTGMFRSGNNLDQSACRNCSFGTYQDEIGQSECKTCPVFQYQDKEGQSYCNPCASVDSDSDQSSETSEQCNQFNFDYANYNHTILES